VTSFAAIDFYLQYINIEANAVRHFYKPFWSDANTTHLLAGTYHENKKFHLVAGASKVGRMFEASDGNSSALECG
jgi:hypothetical protein